MTAQAVALPATHAAHLRPFDPRRDLLEVADLVELCFHDSLDADGRLYIQQLRYSARAGSITAFERRRSERMSGYVWTEEGRVVGNLSLIPHQRGNRRVHLIANVAVHPDYRRRGIAQALTRAALADSGIRRSDEVWLQVDERNAAAIHLYNNMGFEDRLRRTSWRGGAGAATTTHPEGIVVRKSRDGDWRQQRTWLGRLYPDTVTWNLPLELELLLPGWRGTFNRFFGERLVRQWAAQRDGQLLGVLSWQSSVLSNDRLWLAAPEDANPAGISALLRHVRAQAPLERSMALNLPAGFLEDALLDGGFQSRRTLIWMQAHR
jgi:ribosomal protein S18 acetylase RimI-like enzyme